MATSGTMARVFEIAECIDEAFERCLIDPSTTNLRHLVSARRSIDLMFTDWANQDINQWRIERAEETLAVAKSQFSLPAGGIDITNAVLRRDNNDIPMYAISRQEYLDLVHKGFQGRPDRYFVDRERDTPTVFIWVTGENATDIMIYDYIRRFEDAGAPSNTPDIPWRWAEAFCAGLAAKLAVKFAPERKADLRDDAAAALELARQEDRERAPLTMKVDLSGRGRRR